MTRLLWGRSTLSGLPGALALSALAALLVGCGGGSSQNKANETGGTGSVAGTTSLTCPEGMEACACYGNHTCNDGLTCASDLCVNLNVGGASSAGGSSSIGGSSSTSSAIEQGGTAALGTTNAAGAISTGGIVGEGGITGAGGIIGTGGSDTASGSTPVGGATGLGGATAVGGSATAGGSIGDVGGSSTAGQSNVGGVDASGGSQATSGGATAGGQSSGNGLCGNGIVEATEGCDILQHDSDLGDGCSPLCTAEPDCPPAGGGCTTRCGDGIVFGDEQCDDGNAVSGDGCSSACQVEADFNCALAELSDTWQVPMIVRDFKAGGDFEPTAVGRDAPMQGIVKSTLDANGLKPVLDVAIADSYIKSVASFARWYDDLAPAGGNTPNGWLATPLTLYKNDAGTAYVNRWGSNGEQWKTESVAAYSWCGSVGTEDHDADNNPIPCTYCPADTNLATPQCDPAPQLTDCQTEPDLLRCEVDDTGVYRGVFQTGIFDGSPEFFPADGLTPYNPSQSAEIPIFYNGNWSERSDAPPHNFSFTTEVRLWFKYDSSRSYTLNFIGDDDVWIFINKKLAIDLGGIHTPIKGDLTISGDGVANVSVTPTEGTDTNAIKSKPSLDLQNGNVYEIAVFQAERQTTGSSYMLSLSGFNSARSVCTPK